MQNKKSNHQVCHPGLPWNNTKNINKKKIKQARSYIKRI